MQNIMLLDKTNALKLLKEKYNIIDKNYEYLNYNCDLSLVKQDNFNN